MKKKVKVKKLIIISLTILFLLLIGGSIAVNAGHFVSIRGQHLRKYEFSSGGGMTGGYYRETVEKADESFARVVTERAEWHSDVPQINEYLVDIAIFDELERVIRTYGMNFWNNKKFTNILVADGESESYTFSFDENSISFSSQIYPMRYSHKLGKLNKVIDKYLEGAEKISQDGNDITISVTNNFTEADIWILPDTQENRKTTLMGQAQIKSGAEEDTVKLKLSSETDKYLVRMIDTAQMYYSADGVEIENGQSLIIRKGEGNMSAVIEIISSEGEMINEYEMFSARL